MENSEHKLETKLDVNERLKQAFNIYYTKEGKCFKPRPVTIGELINNIQLVKYDRSMEKLNDLIENLFDAKFTFFNKSNRMCSFVRSEDGVPKSKMDIIFYKSQNDVDNLMADVNVNSIAKMLLFSNQGKKVSICIPILNFDVDISNSKIADFISKHKELQDLIKKVKGGANTVSIQLSELFFETETLTNIFSKLNEDQLKIIIFQYASTLSYLQNKYPDLRLNNNLNDLLVYTKKASDRKFHYNIEGLAFSIPDTGMQLKICNFMETSVNEELKNVSISSSKTKGDKQADLINLLEVI